MGGHAASVHRTNNKGHSENGSLLWLSSQSPEEQGPFQNVGSQRSSPSLGFSQKLPEVSPIPEQLNLTQ